MSSSPAESKFRKNAVILQDHTDWENPFFIHFWVSSISVKDVGEYQMYLGNLARECGDRAKGVRVKVEADAEYAYQASRQHDTEWEYLDGEVQDVWRRAAYAMRLKIEDEQYMERDPVGYMTNDYRRYGPHSPDEEE